MRKETRAAVADRQNKIDAHVSKIGQREAQRYIDAKGDHRTKGLIREFLAGVLFLILAYVTTVIVLAL